MSIAVRTKNLLMKLLALLHRQTPRDRHTANRKHTPLVTGYQKGSETVPCQYSPQPGTRPETPEQNLPIFDPTLFPRYVISEKSDAFAASAAHPSRFYRRVLPSRLKIAIGELFSLEFAVDGEMKDGKYFRARRTIYGPRNIFTLPCERN